MAPRAALPSRKTSLTFLSKRACANRSRGSSSRRSTGAGWVVSGAFRSLSLSRTFSVFVLAALLAGTLAPTVSFAQSKPTIPHDSPLAAKVRQFNNSLLALQAAMNHSTAGRAAIRNQAATVIDQRASALRALIQQDPRAALTFAFSSQLLANLADQFPQSAALLELRGTWQGQVEVWTTDYLRPVHSKTTVLMDIGGRKIGLHFAGPQPALESGIQLELTGVIVGSDMAVSHFVVLSGSGAAVAPTPISGGTDPAGGPSWPGPLLFLAMFGFVAMGLFWFRRVREQMFCVLKGMVFSAVILVLMFCNPATGFSQTSACSTTGAQSMAVLLVTFPGIAVPSFSPSLYDQFFGPVPSLNTYWQQASYGAASATGNVFGPFTLSGSYSCANITQFIADSMSAAAASGVDFSQYSRVTVVFPDMSPSCGWSGLSSIGCQSFTTSSGTYTVSVSVLVWSRLEPSVIFHESGHQLGLAHARLREYYDSNGTQIPLGPLTEACYPAGGTTSFPRCDLYEYGDHFSAMGYGNEGHYAAGHKAEILGWLTPSHYQTVQNSGTYTLQPYESSPAGLDALKIQRGTGNSAWLWVEYRQPVGPYDSTLHAQVFGGALIHYQDSSTLPQTDLLDFTAPNTYTDDPALLAGQTWTDPYSNVSITVLSATSTGLTVAVTYGAEPCTASAPSVSLSPANPSIYAGQSASYAVSVTDNDSSACSSSTFNLASTDPAGWSSSLSANSITLSPGQSGSVTLAEGAPLGATPGTYPVAATAASGSDSASGTANATVMASSLAASLAVSGTTFTPPTTVSMTASVSYNGAPASGASVTFTLTSPTGSTTTKSTTTDTSGVATWKYKLNSRASPGTYSAVAIAALSSGHQGGKKKMAVASTQTATSNAVNFTVR